MSTVLTQSTIAAHPDRPAHNGIGLMASMSAGDQGAYIAHDLGAEQAAINLRFVFNPSGLSGGRVVMLACLDGQSGEALRLSYDTDLALLLAWTPGGVELSAQLDAALDWQCIEIGIDTVSGDARLWVNGTLVDQTNGDLFASTLQTVLFGAIHKQTNLVGDLYLDELCIADEYVGPIVVTPTQTHAADPARWLVVYNSADPDAVAWASTYRALRGIPFANLLGMSLPLTETIGATQYADMVGLVEDYLTENRLDDQVMGILLGYRVSGYVDFTGNGPLEAVPALMQTDTLSAGTISNANSSPATYQRLTINDLAGVRMTARLDAHDLATANQLLERADTLIGSGLSGDDSAIYFDPFVGTNPMYQQAFNEMLGWATGIRGMRTRLPIKLSGDPSGNEEANFTSVSGDCAFWGWSSSLPDPDIFTTPVGRRAVCVQLYLEGASATTLRSATPENWADVPIAAGYASAIVSSRDNPVSSIPDAGAFFDALREGWTLGEAWHICQPILRSGFYLVGDPLMTVAMPKQGYEVFGPLQDLEDMDPLSPLYILPDDKTGFDLSDDPPPEGVVRHYVVRRTDELGRIEVSNTSLPVVNVDSTAQAPVSMPVWPDIADWPVDLVNGQIRLIAYWADRIGAGHLQTIELLSQAYGQAIAVAAMPEWNTRDRFVSVTIPVPTVKTHFRWRFTSTGGVQQTTELSEWIEPTQAPTKNLQQIGVSS